MLPYIMCTVEERGKVGVIQRALVKSGVPWNVIRFNNQALCHNALYYALKCFLGRELTRFCNIPNVLILLNESKANAQLWPLFVVPCLALITHRKADESKSSSWCGNCQCAHPASDIPALLSLFLFLFPTHCHDLLLQ